MLLLYVTFGENLLSNSVQQKAITLGGASSFLPSAQGGTLNLDLPVLIVDVKVVKKVYTFH